ncbi:MAG: tripartite tricarboxylate transporter substrate binding protein [Pseudomonadota bacterium]
MLKKLSHVALSCCLMVGSVSAFAADDVYPSKTIRFISQFPAGGTSDVVARLVATKLAEMLGQPVIVENRAGAAGNIGAEYVAKSPPDGYTILAGNNVIVTNPAMQKTPFNVEKDFAPIAIVGATPIALAVHTSLPVANVQELIALIKKSPGKFAYSSCGNGTAQHLAGELFKQKAGIDMVHAGYKGCAPAVIDGVSGHVPIMFNAMGNVQPHAKAGKLKILAVASSTKSANDPNMPTIAEAGVKDFDAEVWFGFLAPAGTPRAVVMKLNEAINKIIKMPDVVQKLNTLPVHTRTSTPEEFSKIIKSDLALWSKLVKDAKIDTTP